MRKEIKLEDSTAKHLRILAVQNNTNLQHYIQNLLKDHVKKSPISNGDIQKPPTKRSKQKA